MREIDVDELARLLGGDDPPAVIDIREAEKHADWRIPGSINLPVIGSIRKGDAAPLHAGAARLPRDRFTVVVCNVGRSSLKAATALEPLGFDVASLRGGMRAWSTAHTVAAITLASVPDATFIQVRRNGKGCLSYLLGSGGDAIVVDPSLDAEVYLELARQHGLRIKTVLETHVHADHVSRARALAATAGAELCMPPNRRVAFKFRAVPDGATLRAGRLELRAIATPGHTGESTCYLVANEALLSGDTVFVDSVGRPDLERGDAGAEAGAKILHKSLHGKVLSLTDDLRVYPAHSGGDIGFDGVPIAARLGDLRALPILKLAEAAFVKRTLEGLGAKPPAYDDIIAVNEARHDLGDTDPVELEAGPNRCAVHA